MAVSPLYAELLQAFDARRRGLRWSMAELDDRAGLQCGYFAKVLHADTPSGRQAGWEMLDLLFAALWPEGAHLAVIPANRSPSGALVAGSFNPVRPGPVSRCVYTAVLEQVDARRRALGLAEDEADELAGVRPRRIAQGTLRRSFLPAGDHRRAVVSWENVDLWRQALWPAGVRVAVFSSAPGVPLASNDNAAQLAFGLRAAGPLLRPAANDNGGQLALDLDVVGPHVTLTSWYARRRKPRKYTPGGCGRRRAA